MRKAKLQEEERRKMQQVPKSDAKLSPNSNLHEKCVPSNMSVKRKAKKSPKKIVEEVVRFVEGNPWESAHDKIREPTFNTEVKVLEHKYIQCNVGRMNDEMEIMLPEEIKPLMINLTFLLYEIKEPKSNEREELCNLLSKIVTLLTELYRRPIKKTGDENTFQTPFDEIAEQISTALKEHSGPEAEQYENLLKEIKQLEEELTEKDSEVNYVKEQIRDERTRLLSSTESLDDRLRNSLLKNCSLKAEIRYNKTQFGKYMKLLVQKEELRQKQLLELNNLRKKYAKFEQTMECKSKAALPKLSQIDSDVLHGGSVTKYIKSKVKKEKKVRPKEGANRADLSKKQIKNKPSI
ncbi:UNVERIFIED_CONTAM: hypothetical protein PYX00_002382 [Menopon gallinae]|uniref:Uncharacterized protein n=1 Tax=Menopon gallinae TaxID=328185 RepID=A0AAW2IHX1_9NEOP